MSAVVSAIVVNYNGGDYLRNCIDSLLSCSPATEIIVVDNASSDTSLDAVSNLGSVQVIRNPSNSGFAAACNIGITAASTDTDLLLFLNPDCSLEPGALKALVDELQGNKDAGMVGALLVNPDGTEQAGGRRAVPTPWRSFVRAFGLTHFSARWPRLFFDFYLHRQPLPEKPIEVEAISGACMLVKRKAIDQVGLWDEGYFLHCEDLDWCMRFRRNDWKVMFVPSARITHALGVCSRSRPIFVAWHKHKGMVRFYRKFFRHQYPSILMGLVLAGVWLRFCIVTIYYTTQRICRSVGLGRG